MQKREKQLGQTQNCGPRRCQTCENLKSCWVFDQNAIFKKLKHFHSLFLGGHCYKRGKFSNWKKSKVPV